MNLTNEIWHQFRKYLPFSAFFGHFLWETRDISSFSENIREILTKFHQIFAEKWPNSLTKIGMKWNFISFRPKSLTVFCWNFEVLAVRRQRNLVELEKCLKNEPTLAIVAVDTEENEPLKVWGVSFHYFNRILSFYLSCCSSTQQPLFYEPPFIGRKWTRHPMRARTRLKKFCRI